MGPMEQLVIYRLGSLGDTIVALPCFHLIERVYPDAQRLLLTNVPVSGKAAPLETIIGPGGFIHGTIAYPYGMRDPVSFFRLRRQLIETGARTLIYITAVRTPKLVWRDVAYFRLCGFTNIIGAPTTSALASNLSQADGTVEPEASRLARTLGPLGPIDLADRSWWDLRLTPEEHAVAVSHLQALNSRQFVAVNTGGKAAEKDWGEVRWQQLLTRLGDQLPDAGLVFVGAGEDRDRAQSLARFWRGETLDLCGKVNPRQSGAVLSRAGLFIGHDSGPFHLADAVNTPAVGLFGSYNVPRKWHPSGSHTRVIHEMAGLAHITPDAVLDVALGLLAQRDPTLAAD